MMLQTRFGLYRIGNEWQGLFGGVTFLDYNAPVTVGKWTDVALVRENGVTKLFVDGLQVGAGISAGLNAPAGVFSIGGTPFNAGDAFDGRIDNVRLALFTGPFDPQTMLFMNAALVPEPSSLALAGLGLVGLAAAGRRRRRMR